ncbi:MFS transporter [Protaetiibacter intestinalis]|uniref:MFS transporter n=1 Tax=Protaetiibacter intestinalis TaxID=2419774 RepID=A0A387B9A8_9MICO|nr:MFS transporter [Protaetiibacter intestinalis]AYF98431.1 MFS transporter [Protaetiibacter intestinalis]
MSTPDLTVKGPSAAFTEPQRAVTGGWIAAFAAAWLGVWMAQLGPFQVLLPVQVDAEIGQPQDWTDSVVAFGIISGIAGAAAIIAFPVTGFLSDRTTSRLGRRRPWVLGGAALFAASLVALGFVHGIVLIATFWALTIVGLCILSSALTALISDLVPVRQRGFVSGWMSAPQAVGIILGVLLITEVFVTVTLGYIAMAVGLAILVLPIVFFTKETPITKAERPQFTLGALLRGMWISPRKHPDFAWTLTSRVLVNSGNALGTGLLLYYLAFGLEIGIDKAEDALLPLIVVYLICVVLTALVVGYLSDRLARRKIFVIWGSLAQAVAAFVLVFVTSYEATFVAGALLGLGYGAFLAVDQALATQVLPDPHDRGKDLGIMNIAFQVPQALAPLLGAFVVDALGGFRGMFMIAALAAAMGALVVSLVRDVK